MRYGNCRHGDNCWNYHDPKRNEESHDKSRNSRIPSGNRGNEYGKTQEELAGMMATYTNESKQLKDRMHFLEINIKKMKRYLQ